MVRLGERIFPMPGNIGERQGVAAEEIVNTAGKGASIGGVASKVMGEADQEELVGHTVVGAPVVLFFVVGCAITGAVSDLQVYVSNGSDLLACAGT